MEAVEKEIFGHLQEKDENGELTEAAKDLLDKLQTPCNCVVTFESEEGYQRASQYNEVVDFMNNPNPNEKMAKYDHFLGVHNGLKIHDVSEPTDIIWENRSITRKTRMVR